MTREEYRAMKEMQNKRRTVERKGYEAAKGAMDWPFFLLTLLLTGIGLAMLFSASFPSAYHESGDATFYVRRQAFFALVGIVAMLGMSKMNYQRLRGMAVFALGGSLFLLVLVIVPGVGITVNNATRWLGVEGVLTFQPSEFAKLGVILYFANSISKKKSLMKKPKAVFLPYAPILLSIALLMMLEPHLSGTILICGIGVTMMIVGGMNRWLVFGGLGGAGALAFGYVKLVDIMAKKDVYIYGAGRIRMWRDPWLDYIGEGYQMAQSLISIGSGGLMGVGFGKGRQKFMFLPEEHNDFIFAIICEELGMIGASLIILIFILLILRGFWIALHARDRFGALLVVGCMTQISLQTFLNMAVVTGLVPATGISLPFFSYGGTALALQLLEMGIVLSVSRQIPAPRNG